jgi:dipeptidyl aminopeptidase/acylaminoacyl peptidase
MKIQNRKNQNIAILLEKAENQKGLAFVMHGLGGFKEQDHIQVFADAFKDKGFTVVRFDTTNTLGESDGKYEDATITNYYEDLEDVISWASKQDWYQEPFCLSGHSLGGICTALYAEKFPDKVLAVAPISPVVSGQLSFEASKKYETKDLEEWEKTGWLIQESNSKKEVTKKLKWSHMADRLKYDLIPNVAKLTMPVLLIVGENDTSTPPEHIEVLYNAIVGDKKELHIIKNAPHTFRDKEHLNEIKKLFLSWIESFEKM